MIVVEREKKRETEIIKEMIVASSQISWRPKIELQPGPQVQASHRPGGAEACRRGHRHHRRWSQADQDRAHHHRTGQPTAGKSGQLTWNQSFLLLFSKDNTIQNLDGCIRYKTVFIEPSILVLFRLM